MVNIWGLKQKRQRARDMLNQELKKPKNKQNPTKINQIKKGMKDLKFKIDKLKEERKGRVKE